MLRQLRRRNHCELRLFPGSITRRRSHSVVGIEPRRFGEQASQSGWHIGGQLARLALAASIINHLAVHKDFGARLATRPSGRFYRVLGK